MHSMVVYHQVPADRAYHIVADLRKASLENVCSLCMEESCKKVKFKYSGSDIGAVLDRLLTAKILSEENGVYTILAETFDKGIEM